MRLPFSRRPRPAAAPSGVPAWRVLAPLAPTVAARPAVLVPDRLPDVAGTRSLTARPVVPRAEAPAGVVSGLAVPLPPRPAVSPSTVERAARRTPPVRDRAPVPAAELVRATDAYVGEARVPAEPHRAPGWMRAASMFPGGPVALPWLPDPAPTPPSFLTNSPLWTPPEGRPVDRPVAPAAMTEDRVTEDRTTEDRAARRRSLGQSRRLGLGAPISRPADEPFAPPHPPVRRAPVEDGAPEPGPGDPANPTTAAGTVAPPLPPPPDDHIEAVPPDLAREVRAAHGVDVADVPVRRGPAADRGAEALGTRAYTQDAEVFLPTRAGAVTRPETRALLAHELVHVVQQRRQGTTGPAEASTEGRALEDEARAVETAVYRGQPLPPPVTTRTVPGRIQRAGPEPDLVHPARPATPAAPQATATTPTPTAPTTPATGTGATTVTTTPATGPSTGSRTGTSTSTGTGTGPGTGTGTGTTQRDEANPSTWSEFGTAMQASVGAAILDQWGIDPDVQAATMGTGTGTGSGTGTGGGGGGGSGGGTGAPRYDRARRREELQRQALALLNADTPAGQPPLTQLTDAQRAEIERTLDAEETAAAAHARSAGTSTGTQSTTSRGAGTNGNGADDRVHSWGEFGGELRYGLVDMMTNPWGIDLAADEVRDLRGRGSAEGTGTAGGGSATTAGGTGARAATTTAAATTATTVAATTAGGAAPGVPQEPEELDELAGRLYDRLRSRLRQELLLDRERAGLLTDFR